MTNVSLKHVAAKATTATTATTVLTPLPTRVITLLPYIRDNCPGCTSTGQLQ